MTHRSMTFEEREGTTWPSRPHGVFIILPVRHCGSCSDLKMSPHANLVISFMRVSDFGWSISHAGKDCISEDGVFVILHTCSESVCVRVCVGGGG